MIGRGGLSGDDRPGWPSGRGWAGVAFLNEDRRGWPRKLELDRKAVLCSPETPGEVSRSSRSAEAWEGDSLGSAKGCSDSAVVSVDWAIIEIKGVDRSEVWGMSSA